MRQVLEIRLAKRKGFLLAETDPAMALRTQDAPLRRLREELPRMVQLPRGKGVKPMTLFEIAVIILMLPGALFGALLMFLLLAVAVQTIGGKHD